MTTLDRALWFAIAGIGALIVGIFVYRNRSTISGWSRTSKGFVSGKARSAYGRVARAADRIMHTERPAEAS